MQEGIFHLSVMMVQRSKGRSATGAIAYRAGIDITDERTGLRFDYTRKTGVSHSEIVLPDGVAEKYRDRNKLWNCIEQAETRKNSSVAREFEIALPADLPPAARTKLAMDYTRYLVRRFEVPADTNLHNPHPRNDDDEGNKARNFHAHILMGTRKLTSDGFTDKVRELDVAKTGSIAIEEAREVYSQMVNAAYAEHGISMFVDHRSNERRGIDEAPQIHVGVNQTGDRAEHNAAIIAAREHIARLELETAAIQLEIQSSLVERTRPGETIPLFALRPVIMNKHGLPLRVAMEPAKPEPQQLELDLTEPVAVVVPQEEKPVQPPPKNIVHLDKVQRLHELEQLKKKAGTYGRALENIREQNGLAASFQRELDNLDRPGLLHRLWNSKIWRTYEDKQADLSKRMGQAKENALKLHVLAKQYKSFQTQWDNTGYAEHNALSKELAGSCVGSVTPKPASKTVNPASPPWDFAQVPGQLEPTY